MSHCALKINFCICIKYQIKIGLTTYIKLLLTIALQWWMRVYKHITHLFD